jgi:hypothetical protein
LVGVCALALMGLIAAGCSSGGSSGSGELFGKSDDTTTTADGDRSTTTAVATTEAPTTTTEAPTTTTEAPTTTEYVGPVLGEIVNAHVCKNLHKTDGMFDDQIQVEANRGLAGTEIAVEVTVEHAAAGHDATRKGTGEMNSLGNGVVYIPVYSEDEVITPSGFTMGGEVQEVDPGNVARASSALDCDENIDDD